MQFCVRKLFALVAIMAFLLLGCQFMYQLVNTPSDAYAAWGAGDLVIEFMEAKDGGWPSSWSELEEFLESTENKNTMGGAVSDLQKRIVIDFKFDIERASSEIQRDDDVARFRPIRLRSGSNAYFEGSGPNQRVFEYLKDKKFPSLESQ